MEKKESFTNGQEDNSKGYQRTSTQNERNYRYNNRTMDHRDDQDYRRYNNESGKKRSNLQLQAAKSKVDTKQGGTEKVLIPRKKVLTKRKTKSVLHSEKRSRIQRKEENQRREQTEQNQRPIPSFSTAEDDTILLKLDALASLQKSDFTDWSSLGNVPSHILPPSTSSIKTNLFPTSIRRHKSTSLPQRKQNDLPLK